MAILLPIIKKMKCTIYVLAGLIVLAGPLIGETSESPLTPLEQSLNFAPAYLRTDDHVHGYLLVHSEPLTAARLKTLSPWDLMELVQTLSKVEVPLSRFGDNDDLTQAWRRRLVAFAATADAPPPPVTENIFDPALVLWDPGYIQFKNASGQWSIHLANRDIVQSDLATLSPLEVQQAVEVLTARTYPIDFVLDHLEAFRAQLSVVPRE